MKAQKPLHFPFMYATKIRTRKAPDSHNSQVLHYLSSFYIILIQNVNFYKVLYTLFILQGFFLQYLLNLTQSSVSDLHNPSV